MKLIEIISSYNGLEYEVNVYRRRDLNDDVGTPKVLPDISGHKVDE